MFLPQTPYCPTGSLQDKLTYPDRLDEEMSTADLRAVLTEVNLEHLADRNDGGGAASELSLGEMQQLAIARVLLTDPAFAVLDEATSAIDPAVEKVLFEKLQRRGVTLITVSHRPSLLQVDAVFKMMSFVSKMMNFVSKMMIFAVSQPSSQDQMRRERPPQLVDQYDSGHRR